MANLDSIRELLAEQLKTLLGAELHLDRFDPLLSERATDSLVCEVLKKNARDRAHRVGVLRRKIPEGHSECLVTTALIEEAVQTERFTDPALRDLALIFVLRRILTHAVVCCDNAQSLAAATDEKNLAAELESFCGQRRAMLENLADAEEALTPRSI